MFTEIETTRLEMGLCHAKLILLARYSAKRQNINEITHMSATERYELLEMMRTMHENGRPVSNRCCEFAATG